MKDMLRKGIRQMVSCGLGMLLVLMVPMVLAFAEGGVKYLSPTVDGGSVTFNEETADLAIEISNTTTTLGGDGSEAYWYVVNDTVEITDRITVSGDVHLILADSTTLTASSGITVEGENSLTIYAQSTEDNIGILKATAATVTTQYEATDAGIGGTVGNSAGTIIINGGVVTAIGGANSFSSSNAYAGTGAGIGGGGGSSSDAGDGGIITINGGTVTATGGAAVQNDSGTGAGIGGGGGASSSSNNYYAGDGGTININGGIIIATGGGEVAYSGTGAGIGGGGANKNFATGAGGDITIAGGNVTATGGAGANNIGTGAGIGSGGAYRNDTSNANGDGGTIIITGGTVIAEGGTGTSAYSTGAGIGGGGAYQNAAGNGGNITIDGGDVTATGGTAIGDYGSGAGIGGGGSSNASAGSGGTVAINGGTVTASGGSGSWAGAGIGSGRRYNTAITTSGTMSIDTALGYATSSSSLGSELILVRGTGEEVSNFPTDQYVQVQNYVPTYQNPTNLEILTVDGDYTEIDTTTTTWSSGWYTVCDAVTLSDVTVSGDVYLILEDGATLTVSNGITLNSGSNLTIYAQSTGSSVGNLVVESGGIGGGALTINGGTIMSTGGDNSAAIAGDTITIASHLMYGTSISALSDITDFTSGTDIAITNFSSDKYAILTCSAVSYLDENGVTNVLTDPMVIDSATTMWSTGWYVVDSTVTISSRITVTGDVHLILANSTTLTASSGITVEGENSLTIYAQTDDDNMGKLIATAGDTAGIFASSGFSSNTNAGIGGTAENNAGTIIINGGNISATGGYASFRNQFSGGGYYLGTGAGIGGGGSYSGVAGAGGMVVINGGIVTATGGSTYSGNSTYAGTGAGIGGGGSYSGTAGNGGTVTIAGGTVYATGGADSTQYYTGTGAGIGGGGSSNGTAGAGATVTITGGTVSATGGFIAGASSGTGAGIGGGGGSSSGTAGNGGTVTIDNGTVIATGGAASSTTYYTFSTGAGIGGGGANYGAAGAGGVVIINGGIITAKGGASTRVNSSTGAGIGGGGGSGTGATVTIASGAVSATGGAVTGSTSATGAGIGGGGNHYSGNTSGDGGIVRIIGGTVTATGGSASTSDSGAGAGIGGGGTSKGTTGVGGKISIEGGSVTAIGGNSNSYKGAGIGSGSKGYNGSTLIASGTVSIKTCMEYGTSMSSSITNFTAGSGIETDDFSTNRYAKVQPISLTFTTQPSDVSVDHGVNASLSVTASLSAGSDTIAYQWYACDNDGSNASAIVASDTFDLSSLDVGTYYYYCVASCTFDDAEIVATSDIATVSITTRTVTQDDIAITLDTTSFTYDGMEKTPSVSITDKIYGNTIAASEYTVTYSDNTNVGTATVTITDVDGGNYEVSGSKTFTITAASSGTSTDSSSDSTATVSMWYIVTLSTSGGGSLAPELNVFETVTMQEGTSYTFSITPDSGYAIAAVYVDGTNIGAVSEYTIDRIHSNRSIHVDFVPTGVSAEDDATDEAEGNVETEEDSDDAEENADITEVDDAADSAAVGGAGAGEADDATDDAETTDTAASESDGDGNRGSAWPVVGGVAAATAAGGIGYFAFKRKFAFGGED